MEKEKTAEEEGPVEMTDEEAQDVSGGLGSNLPDHRPPPGGDD